LALYTWTGYTEKGKETKGMVDAVSIREAKSKLRSQGVFVSKVIEEAFAGEVSKEPRARTLSNILTRVRVEDLSIMTRQLSTLVSAAIPLVEALSALYEQLENPLLKKTIAQVRDSVNEGQSFADALGQHKKIFPDLYINMVRSGEASGALDIVLLRLAEFMEGQHRLRSKIAAAMVYPILLFVVCIAVLMYLLTAVVPKVVSMFESMNQVLPLPTRMLIGISNFLVDTWWMIIVLCLLSGYVFIKWRNTDKGSVKFDRFRIRMPVLGPVHKKACIARFARTLGTMLASGVPILDAMRIVKSVVQNRIIETAIEDSISEIMDGSSIAFPLKKSGVFPPIILHMIRVGEKSGRLEEMLLKAADAYEQDVETSVVGLSSILEPVMILIMGVSVGFVVMSILFPMLEMSQIVK